MPVKRTSDVTDATRDVLGQWGQPSVRGLAVKLDQDIGHRVIYRRDFAHNLV